MISEGNPLQLADVENAHWQVDLEAVCFSLYLFLSLVRAILKLIQLDKDFFLFFQLDKDYSDLLLVVLTCQE